MNRLLKTRDWDPHMEAAFQGQAASNQKYGRPAHWMSFFRNLAPRRCTRCGAKRVHWACMAVCGVCLEFPNGFNRRGWTGNYGRQSGVFMAAYGTLKQVPLEPLDFGSDQLNQAFRYAVVWSRPRGDGYNVSLSTPDGKWSEWPMGLLFGHALPFAEDWVEGRM